MRQCVQLAALCLLLQALLHTSAIWGVGAVAIAARVVKQSADANLDIHAIDFAPISGRLLEQRGGDASDLVPADFVGPELLRPLTGQCFLHDDSKYVFRVCPFANVTQHEKSQYAFNFLTTSFHAILGIWREWRVENNTFDSLIYLQGDPCEQGIARRVYMKLHCSHDWTMVDLAYVRSVTELAKCVYEAHLASSLFCELGSVYSRLDSSGQHEWDVLQTVYHNGLITREGYNHYLQTMLARYGLAVKEADEPTKTAVPIEANFNENSTAEMNLCEENVQRLQHEIKELKSRLGLIEQTNKTVEL